VEAKKESLSECTAQSWHADSQRKMLTGGSIVEVTRLFFEVNTKMQLQISPKEKL
jgi:hypothetical protein